MFGASDEVAWPILNVSCQDEHDFCQLRKTTKHQQWIFVPQTSRQQLIPYVSCSVPCVYICRRCFSLSTLISDVILPRTKKEEGVPKMSLSVVFVGTGKHVAASLQYHLKHWHLLTKYSKQFLHLLRGMVSQECTSEVCVSFRSGWCPDWGWSWGACPHPHHPDRCHCEYRNNGMIFNR